MLQIFSFLKASLAGRCLFVYNYPSFGPPWQQAWDPHGDACRRMAVLEGRVAVPSVQRRDVGLTLPRDPELPLGSSSSFCSYTGQAMPGTPWLDIASWLSFPENLACEEAAG